MLEALDRGNLFLVPLDDRRRWYRYHHLFADVLRARLLDEQPDLVQSCTAGRATGTSENGERARGHRPRAGRRGLRARGGPGRAGDPGHGRDRQEATLRGWLERLPDELFAAGPCSASGTSAR